MARAGHGRSTTVPRALAQSGACCARPRVPAGRERTTSRTPTSFKRHRTTKARVQPEPDEERRTPRTTCGPRLGRSRVPVPADRGEASSLFASSAPAHCRLRLLIGAYRVGCTGPGCPRPPPSSPLTPPPTTSGGGRNVGRRWLRFPLPLPPLLLRSVEKENEINAASTRLQQGEEGGETYHAQTHDSNEIILDHFQGTEEHSTRTLPASAVDFSSGRIHCSTGRLPERS
uniref:Uncharacterized protein n=1 Tax=Anopheles atroparvus TaxID=41427 RepID=A0A182JK35_ANOAO